MFYQVFSTLNFLIPQKKYSSIYLCRSSSNQRRIYQFRILGNFQQNISIFYKLLISLLPCDKKVILLIKIFFFILILFFLKKSLYFLFFSLFLPFSNICFSLQGEKSTKECKQAVLHSFFNRHSCLHHLSDWLLHQPMGTQGEAHVIL